MSKIYSNINGLRDMTAEEQAEYDKKNLSSNKLEIIKGIVEDKLSETDILVIRETITNAQKTWRINLSNIETDYSEEQYDDLLARDSDGKLTHSIWSKP